MKRVVAVADLGTTNTKVSLMDEMGRVVSQKALPTPFLYNGDIMEMDIRRHYDTVLSCCRGAIAGMGEPVHVDALSVSTMAASFVPLDEGGNPLMDTIGWGDCRSHKYTYEFLDSFLKGEAIPGCGQYPLTMYAPFKLQYLQKKRPEIFSKIKKWLNVSEYFYYRILGEGEFVTDHSIASRTMLFNVHERRWNENALAYFNIDADILPDAREAGTVVGCPCREAQAAGLSPDTKIVLGGHDHMCAMTGAGITVPGVILNSTGTSETVECLAERTVRPEDVVNKWINLECSTIPGGIATVNYVGATGLVYQCANEALREYDAEAGQMPVAEPVFIPPQRAQMSSVRGSMHNIPTVFNAGQLNRAMRDGMFFECRRGVERLLNGKSMEDAVIRCVGGHAKNREEMQLKCDALGCPIVIGKKEDIASKGAFILGGYGCGWFSSIEETSRELYKNVETETLTPDKLRSEMYEAIYRETYLPLFEKGIYSL